MRESLHALTSGLFTLVYGKNRGTTLSHNCFSLFVLITLMYLYDILNANDKDLNASPVAMNSPKNILSNYFS